MTARRPPRRSRPPATNNQVRFGIVPGRAREKYADAVAHKHNRHPEERARATRARVSKDGSRLRACGHPSRRPLADASGLLRMTVVLADRWTPGLQRITSCCAAPGERGKVSAGRIPAAGLVAHAFPAGVGHGDRVLELDKAAL